MIACSSMALIPEGSPKWPEEELRVIMAARRSKSRPYHYKQPLTYLFIDWLLGLTLTPGLTRPLWDLLGHYGFYRSLWIGHYGLCFTNHIE